MAIVRAQVILHTVDAVPENFISNSWAFELASPSTADTDLTPILKDFYDDLGGLLSNVIATNGHEIKYSLLPGTPPNYPFDTGIWNFTAALGGTPLPDEVAICLSFQGVRGAGNPQARRRGRLYLGPLRTTVATSNRPSSSAQTTIASAAQTLASAVDALGPGNAWVVWSPTDGAAVNIADGWIDNAFDTQRRRGVGVTSRTTFTV